MCVRVRHLLKSCTRGLLPSLSPFLLPVALPASRLCGLRRWNSKPERNVPDGGRRRCCRQQLSCSLQACCQQGLWGGCVRRWQLGA